MAYTWTTVQRQRLKELNATEEQQELIFDTSAVRNKVFQEIEHLLVEKAKEKLNKLRETGRRPSICELESKLVKVLTDEGFVQVVTPILLAKGLLAKMTITEEHHLFRQVFWVEEKKCLRPMLAPNLYFLLKDLVRLWDKPIRIFEIGSCFRKETQGLHHLNEFTMLNLVELGLPEETRMQRLKELATLIMKAIGIERFSLERKDSEVYGSTIDVMAGFELGSGAMGPLPLDEEWGIVDPWVGIGFGLERLLMVKEGTQNVQSMAKSITYLNGVRLNI